MARAAALVALALAAGAAAWPFESTAKGGLALNATKLPAYLTGNNTALFKEGLAQAKEKLNATGLFNTSVNLVRTFFCVGQSCIQACRFFVGWLARLAASFRFKRARETACHRLEAETAGNAVRVGRRGRKCARARARRVILKRLAVRHPLRHPNRPLYSHPFAFQTARPQSRRRRRRRRRRFPRLHQAAVRDGRVQRAARRPRRLLLGLAVGRRHRHRRQRPAHHVR